MAPATEWRQARGSRFGSEDWSFDVGSSMHVTSTTPLFLADGITIERNILYADLTLSLKDGFLGGFVPTLGASVAFFFTLNATDVVTDEYLDDVPQFLPEHTILGTAMMTCAMIGDSATGADTLYQYTLNPPLDLHGSRHFPASGDRPEVTLNLSVYNDGPLMDPGNGSSFQLNTWLRTLYQQATT